MMEAPEHHALLGVPLDEPIGGRSQKPRSRFRPQRHRRRRQHDPGQPPSRLLSAGTGHAPGPHQVSRRSQRLPPTFRRSVGACRSNQPRSRRTRQLANSMIEKQRLYWRKARTA